MSWCPQADINTVETRARMLHSIRAFFDARDVLEVETPVLSRAAVTDVHLDSIAAQNRDQQVYLNTSPEYCMKRMLAQYRRSIYQISHCFREAEQGPHHNPEFTMLEWYRVDFNLQQLMQEVETLLLQLLAEHGVCSSKPIHITYRQLFIDVLGIDPHHVRIEQCANLARQRGLDVPAGLATAGAEGVQAEVEKDAWLDWFISCVIAEQLPADQITFIYDYPVTQAALARIQADQQGDRVARRFECYFGSLELANGYQELTDSRQQRQRFERDNIIRQLLGKPVIAIDEYLLQALDAGLPECAGVAVGLDRLLMLLCGSENIADCLSFPWRCA